MLGDHRLDSLCWLIIDLVICAKRSLSGVCVLGIHRLGSPWKLIIEWALCA